MRFNSAKKQEVLEENVDSHVMGKLYFYEM